MGIKKTQKQKTTNANVSVFGVRALPGLLESAPLTHIFDKIFA
jgi:hypothetical protein